MPCDEGVKRVNRVWERREGEGMREGVKYLKKSQSRSA